MSTFLSDNEIKKLPTKVILALLYERRETIEYPLDSDNDPVDYGAGEYIAELNGAISDIKDGGEPYVALNNIGEAIKQRDVDAYYRARKSTKSTNTVTRKLYPSELVRLSGDSSTLGLAIFLLLTTTREDAVGGLRKHIKDAVDFTSYNADDILYYCRYEYFFMGISDANFEGIKNYFSVRYSKYLLASLDTLDAYIEVQKFAAIISAQYKKDGVLK